MHFNVCEYLVRAGQFESRGWSGTSRCEELEDLFETSRRASPCLHQNMKYFASRSKKTSNVHSAPTPLRTQTGRVRKADIQDGCSGSRHGVAER